MKAVGVRIWAAVAFAIFLAACTGMPAEGGALDSLEIATSTGRHVFQVEVANNDAAREHGLMDRRYMAPDHGMLFEFDRDEPVAFWMKNTYIPLDMVFIAPGGRIVKIIADAHPFSLNVLSSDVPVAAVLEIRGGEAQALGLAVGDRVTWKAL